MVRRAKLVSDLVELVPVLQLLSTETYRKVYETLLSEWKTLNELKELYGEKVEEVLKILKNAVCIFFPNSVSSVTAASIAS